MIHLMTVVSYILSLEHSDSFLIDQAFVLSIFQNRFYPNFKNKLIIQKHK
jgi:hypothetical protein